jgi:restriction system protein
MRMSATTPALSSKRRPTHLAPATSPYSVSVAAWSDYQEEIAEFFRSLGILAATNVAVKGVRTSHDVDVFVRSKHAGFDIQWIVECKAWKTAIPKEKVLALRMIVDDTGADRGFIMAESGYQSGALEAARHANVTLTSLADLKETLAYEVGMAKLESLIPRTESFRERYWTIDKEDRINLDLRPDVGFAGYSGAVVMRAVEHTIRQAMFSGFPIVYSRMEAALSSYGGRATDLVEPGSEGALNTPSGLFEVLDEELSELERRLQAAEAALERRQTGPSGSERPPRRRGVAAEPPK